MALSWPVFQIFFWLITPIFLLALAFFSYKDFKWWKIAMGISGFVYLNAVTLTVEKFGDNPTIVVGVLIVSGLIALFAANKLRQ